LHTVLQGGNGHGLVGGVASVLGRGEEREGRGLRLKRVCLGGGGSV
jgi:hypothetical protein